MQRLISWSTASEFCLFFLCHKYVQAVEGSSVQEKYMIRTVYVLVFKSELRENALFGLSKSTLFVCGYGVLKLSNALLTIKFQNNGIEKY